MDILVDKPGDRGTDAVKHGHVWKRQALGLGRSFVESVIANSRLCECHW